MALGQSPTRGTGDAGPLRPARRGAAAICVAIELRQEWDHVWVYLVVFVLATVANQGIFSAGLIW